MKKKSIETRVLKHIKKGLQHININHSKEIKNISKEVKLLIKSKKNLSTREVYDVLRKKSEKVYQLNEKALLNGIKNVIGYYHYL